MPLDKPLPWVPILSRRKLVTAAVSQKPQVMSGKSLVSGFHLREHSECKLPPLSLCRGALPSVGIHPFSPKIDIELFLKVLL